MIDDPDRWAPGYAELGAYSVTFHAEATGDPVAVARSLRARGARAGHRAQARYACRGATSSCSPSSTRCS